MEASKVGKMTEGSRPVGGAGLAEALGQERKNLVLWGFREKVHVAYTVGTNWAMQRFGDHVAE